MYLALLTQYAYVSYDGLHTTSSVMSRKSGEAQH